MKGEIIKMIGSNSTRISIVLSKETNQKLTDASKKLDLTKGAIIRYLIAKYLDDFVGKDEK